MSQLTQMMNEVPPLSCEALPGFVDGVIHGRLLARKYEATRCMLIMTSAEGRCRPVAAWALLPYSLGVEATIKALDSRCIEDVALDLQREGMMMLRERYKLACGELALFEAEHTLVTH